MRKMTVLFGWKKLLIWSYDRLIWVYTDHICQGQFLFWAAQMDYAYVCQNVANILRVVNTVWIPFTNRPAPSLDAGSKQDDGSAWEINNAERWHLFIIPSTLPQPLTQFWPPKRNIEYRLLLHVHKRSPVQPFLLLFVWDIVHFDS